MLLLVLILFAPLFTLQTELLLNYDGFNPIGAVSSASAAYTSASSSSSTATTVTYAQQQVQWPPTAVRSNWYILDAAANAAVAAAATTQVDAARANKLHKRHKALPRDKQPHSAARHNLDTPQAAQQKEQQKNPANYYTYNSSNNGNYRSTAPDMRFVAPYVLALNNRRRLSMTSGERSRWREHSDNTTDRIVNNFNKRGYVNTYNNNYSNKSVIQHNKYGDNEQTATTKVNIADSIVTQPQHQAMLAWQDIKIKSDGGVDEGRKDVVPDIDESMEVGSVENDINSLEEAHFNEVLVPLGNALDKVQHFCEVFRRIINDGAADFVSGDLDTSGSSEDGFTNSASATLAQSATVDTVIPVGDNTQLALEVQGQRSPPNGTHSNTQQSQSIAEATLMWPTVTARSTAVTASAQATTTGNALNSAKSLTSTALVIGRGKKLKKKLKKLMLPLLLAYKLKFIALVPLLIGGLTLLVGSTGLAGFFFALFLTVMTLKGGGSVNKSIVIKKVL
ncbi:PREDICTED: uncharacterized protein LOC108973987 [Bactrocera latifrons]|uniref:Uncharacterized protein n=1 Tax=Bactrocera latifrons TaxID=174628 RepID=A0A0K8UYZ0_BACLA|nr:PREDICTED: uncharacterized protein LOC108973987 [Bactrocera latifrons]